MARTERFLTVLAASVPLAASAAESGFTVDVGAGRTNNIERAPTGGHSENIVTVGTQFLVQHQSSSLDADVGGDLAWYDYSGKAYDPELVGTFNAATRLGLVQDRFAWNLDDSFGQTRRDLFTAPSPLNRENINYFSTGPDLRLHLGSALEVLAQARYALASYETSPLDSTRKTGLLGLQHELESTATIGVSASREHVAPHGAATFSSYDHDEAYLRYAARGALTTLSIEAGASRIDQNGATDSSSLLRFSLSRKVAGWSTLTARLGREQTDPAGSLSTGKGQLEPATLDTQSLSQTAAPYVSDYLDLGWQISGRVTFVGLGATMARENYLHSTAQDRRRSDLNVTASRVLGPRLSARANLQYSRYNYLHSVGDNNSKMGDLALSWRLGRKLFAEVSGSYYRYSSDVISGQATEARYWLRLRYGNSIAAF